MEKLRDLLSQLDQTDQRQEILEGIRPALGSLSRKETEDGLKVLSETMSLSIDPKIRLSTYVHHTLPHLPYLNLFISVY